MLLYGIENYKVSDLAVNEDNPQAKGFYEHIGFKVYKRNELDDQGKPYNKFEEIKEALFCNKKCRNQSF